MEHSTQGVAVVTGASVGIGEAIAARLLSEGHDLDYAMALNVRPAMVLSKAFVPGMREAKFGRLVSMSSRAVLGKTQRVVYSAAKAALIWRDPSLALCKEYAVSRGAAARVVPSTQGV